MGYGKKNIEKYGEVWYRIREVMLFCRCPSVNQFAKHIGLKRSEILYRIQRGQNGLSGALANRIIDSVPQISLRWLRFGEGEMFDEHTERILQLLRLK